LSTRTEFREYVRQPWAQFKRALVWNQGEHMIVCGGTGWGKSTLIASILDKRDGKVCVIGTKFEDDTYKREFQTRGYKRVDEWPPQRELRKVLLWPYPKFPTIRENEILFRDRIRPALDGMMKQQRWCIVIDEALHLSGPPYSLGREITALQSQGRSSKITNVLGFQRPSGIPLIVYDSAPHIFTARSLIEVDAKRIAGMGGLNSSEVAYNLARLRKFEYLYIPTREPDRDPVIVNAKR
jgi:energy-coupling factor transporter ATP-binding protein EcfA2